MLSHVEREDDTLFRPLLASYHLEGRTGCAGYTGCLSSGRVSVGDGRLLTMIDGIVCTAVTTASTGILRAKGRIGNPTHDLPCS